MDMKPVSEYDGAIYKNRCECHQRIDNEADSHDSGHVSLRKLNLACCVITKLCDEKKPVSEHNGAVIKKLCK